MPINQIIHQMKEQQAQTTAKRNSVKINTFEYLQAEEEADINRQRVSKFYYLLTHEMNESQLDALEDYAKNVMGEESYKSAAGRVAAAKKISKHFVPEMGGMFLRDLTAEHYGEICAIVGDEVADRAWAEAQSFIPADYDPTPIHPLENQVASLKERLPELVQDENQRTQLSADLDEINEMVTETNKSFASNQTSRNASYSRVNSAQNYQEGTKLLNNGVFGQIGEHMRFDAESNQFTMHDYLEDRQLKGAMQSVEAKYSPEYKAKIIAILKRMDELELVPENATGKEESQKIYGFRKLVDAQTQLKNAVQNGEVDKIHDLKVEYANQMQNMRELFAMVEDAIPDDNHCVPNNVDNLRTDFIPAEFKKSVSTNSNVNSLWITLSFIKQSGATIEEFVDHPISHLRGVILNQFNKIAPDKKHDGKSISQVLISEAYTKVGDNVPNWLGTLRATDALLGGDSENSAYNSTVVRVLEKEMELACPHAQEYIDVAGLQNERDTLANIFLVNDEDREYAKMPTDKNKSADGFTEYPSFDPVKYLNEHDIDFKAMADRMGNAIKEFSDAILAQPKNKRDLSFDVVKIMRSVRCAGARALLTKNPDPTEPGVKELAEFLENPLKALERYGVTKDAIRGLNSLRGKDALHDPVKAIQDTALNLKTLSSGKEKAIKGFTSGEKAYNEKADTILKEAERLSKQVAKEKDPAKVEKLQIESVKKMNELKALQKSEVEKLENAFKDGKITAYYLKNRTEKIGSLNHNEKTAMFEADAFPSKSDYIKSTGLEELTSDEKKGLYESAKLRALDEKQRFINRRLLEEIKMGDASGRGLLSKEEISAEGVAKAMNLNAVDTAQLEVKPVEAQNSISIENGREPIVVDEAIEKETVEVQAKVEEVKQPISEKMP